MNIQLIDISFPEVYARYNKKYDIYREFCVKGTLGIELYEIGIGVADFIQKIVFSKNEICFKAKSSKSGFVDILILGHIPLFNSLTREIISLGNETLGYQISKLINNYVGYDKLSFTIGNKVFNNSESYIAGILNVTPDSFSDGGKYNDTDNAIEHAIEMLNDGADIIDVGGESTRPGSETISVEEELNRVIPVIKGILKYSPKAIVSVDTTKKQVAEEAVKNGVRIINDISAGDFEPDIFKVAKRYNAAIILMHMKGKPRTMQVNPTYEDVVKEVYGYLFQKVENAKKAGISNMIIDPGFGFGKRMQDNYELLKRLDEFKGIGIPIMVGLSRKTFLGKSLNLEVNERDIPTVIAETLAIKNGARFIRTHNIKNAVHSKKILKYLQNPEELYV